MAAKDGFGSLPKHGDPDLDRGVFQRRVSSYILYDYHPDRR